MLRCADRGLTHHETWSVLVELREDRGLDPDGGGERLRQQPAEKAILSLSPPKFEERVITYIEQGCLGKFSRKLASLRWVRKPPTMALSVWTRGLDPPITPLLLLAVSQHLLFGRTLKSQPLLQHVPNPCFQFLIILLIFICRLTTLAFNS